MKEYTDAAQVQRDNDTIGPGAAREGSLWKKGGGDAS